MSEESIESFIDEEYKERKTLQNKWICFYFDFLSSWYWDPVKLCGNDISIENRTILKKSSVPGWGTGMLKKCISRGVAIWELEIKSVGCNISVGVSDGKKFINNFVGGRKGSWCNYCGSQIFENGKDVTWNNNLLIHERVPWRPGDVIGCVLDLRKVGTLTYFVNGSKKLEFTDMKKDLKVYYPTVTMYNKHECVEILVGSRMKFNKSYNK